MAAIALTASLEGQLTALRSVVRAAGARLSHVKPHGALYNRAAVDSEMAALVAGVVREFDASLVLVALAGSRLLEQGEITEG